MKPLINSWQNSCPWDQGPTNFSRFNRWWGCEACNGRYWKGIEVNVCALWSVTETSRKRRGMSLQVIKYGELSINAPQLTTNKPPNANLGSKTRLTVWPPRPCAPRLDFYPNTGQRGGEFRGRSSERFSCLQLFTINKRLKKAVGGSSDFISLFDGAKASSRICYR